MSKQNGKDPYDLQPGDQAPVVCFCVPTGGSPTDAFTQCYASAYARACMNFVATGMGVMAQQWVGGTYIDANRNDLARKALEIGASYLIFFDDDMEFPPTVATRLLQHMDPRVHPDKDVRMVGVNYVTRKPPPEPVTLTVNDNGTRYWPDREATGLTEVGAVGFGIVAIRADVFEGIEYPYFYRHFDHQKQNWVGEDIDLCRKVRQAGHRIWVDNDLSEECQHAGFDLEYARKWRDQAEKERPKLELVKR